MEPVILHIETSERLCSVCVSKGQVCIDQINDDSGDHQSTLAPNIKKLLMDNDLNYNNLDAISTNMGPGSYTSLRVGVIMAKGLAAINRKPLIAITGLKALAHESCQRFPNLDIHIPLIDARRSDVYFAVFDRSLNELRSPEFTSLTSLWFEEMGFEPGKCAISGSGAAKWESLLPDYQVSVSVTRLTAQLLILPSLEIFKQEGFVSPSELKPFYLKDPNITQAKKKL